eukprot:2513725-Pyramimonas_sp.AAC.1
MMASRRMRGKQPPPQRAAVEGEIPALATILSANVTSWNSFVGRMDTMDVDLLLLQETRLDYKRQMGCSKACQAH